MSKRFVGILLLAASAFSSSPVADVAGRWTGTFSVDAPSHGGPEPPVAALLILQQDGASVTGTAGAANGPQHAISKGTVNGNKVTLEVQETDMTVKFDLVLNADRMTGQVNMTGGKGPSGKAVIDVTRAK